MYSVLLMMQNEKPAHTGVKKIIETHYTAQSYLVEEGASPDTTITLGDQESELYLQDSIVWEYITPTDVIKKSYDLEGKLVSVTGEKYNDRNQMVFQKVDYKDEAKSFLSTTKSIVYDDQHRLKTMKEKTRKIFHIDYHEGHIFKTLVMDAGMMAVKATAEMIGDTIRYNMEADLGAMKELLGDKDMPKEYSDLLTKGDTLHIIGYKEDQEAGTINVESEVKMSKDLKVFEIKTKTYDGFEHISYSYDDLGRVINRTNKSTGESIDWIYDNNGNMTKGIEEDAVVHNTFDERNNEIQRIGMSPFDTESVYTLVKRKFILK